MHVGEDKEIFMNLLTKIIFIPILFGTSMLDVSAAIVVANSSSNSIMISVERYEKYNTYFLEVKIKGISPKAVKLRAKNHRLTLIAKQENTQQSAVAGGQFIRYTYRFKDDADMSRLSRVDHKHKITISIPKR